MTKTDEYRKPRLRSLVQGPWHVGAFGLVLICLGKIYLWPKGNSWLIGGAVSLCVLAGFLVDFRLRDRKRGGRAKERRQLTEDGTAALSEASKASQASLGFDLWAIGVPVLAVFGTQFARDHGWLGNNATGRTDTVVILGIVLTAAVGRLWWRNRQENRGPTQARKGKE